jgi:GMP synthase-like glutamine amidotransferase
MSGRVLIIKNTEYEGPGMLREVLHVNDVEADCVELWRSDDIPSLDPYSALIVLGGLPSVNDQTPEMQAEREAAAEALRSGLPYLGICLGHQVLGQVAGSRVDANAVREIGFHHTDGEPYTVELTDAGQLDPLFDGVPESFPVFQLHGEAVQPFSEIEVLATGKHCAIQAIRVGRRAYGLQMHVEVTSDMLAVWASEHPDLAHATNDDLQRDLAAISDQYNRVGRRILTNFLSLAGLASSVEVDLGKVDVR